MQLPYRAGDINTRTAEKVGAVETLVPIRISVWTREVHVWCSKETSLKLTKEDWNEVRERMQSTMDGACAHLWSNGVMPSTMADELNRRCDEIAPSIVVEIFRKRHTAAGNLIFQVDPLLNGREYEV